MNIKGAGKVKFKLIYVLYAILVVAAIFLLYELTKINGSTYVIEK